MNRNSKRFQSMIDEVIGTKEIVLLRRKIDAMLWFARDINPKYRQLFSGSRGEGLAFFSSDFDVMFVDRETSVYNSIHDIVVGDTSKKTELIMRREGCQPGFVTLQLLNNTPDKLISKSLVQFGDTYVVSSILFRDLHLDQEYDQIIHGPCCTDIREEEVELDMAYCFACTSWPTEAAEFITRPRNYGWPSQLLLKKITRKGCHVVAIGDKESDLASIQWRISFSAAEKTLIHSLTHKQIEVYGTLKLFLKNFINKDQTVKDLLCSYFLKTVLFFAIENTQDRFWICNSTMRCTSYCLLSLLDKIRMGICPNYFVTENNMFRSKVHGQNQTYLLRFFQALEPLLWGNLQGVQQLPIYNSVFDKRLMILLSKEMEIDALLFSRITQVSFTAADDWMLIRYLTQCCKLLQYARTRLEKDLASILFHHCLGATATMSTIKATALQLHGNNRTVYHIIKNQEQWLKRYSTTDFSRGKLTLASFYFRRHEYCKCIDTCERLVSKWRQDTYYWLPNLPWMKDYVNELSAADKVKRFLALHMIIFQDAKEFFPCELQHDLSANYPYMISIPPLPYAFFLLFLCHHAVGNIDESLRCIHNLRSVVHDLLQGCAMGRNHIVQNVLAICLRKVGDIEGAVKVCMKSLRQKPERNGANLLLNDILSAL